MFVNGRKTKEILIGSILKDPHLSVTLERVKTFKLLGVHVANDLKCAQHVEAKAQGRITPLFLEAAETLRRHHR